MKSDRRSKGTGTALETVERSLARIALQLRQSSEPPCITQGNAELLTFACTILVALVFSMLATNTLACAGLQRWTVTRVHATHNLTNVESSNH